MGGRVGGTNDGVMVAPCHSNKFESGHGGVCGGEGYVTLQESEWGVKVTGPFE